MQNIEFKAELRDLALARTIADSINAPIVLTLRQTDTYYRVPDARLKRRECSGAPTEYIFYSRVNRARPKISQFVIYSETQARERFGANMPPVLMVVKKTRELRMHDGIRIHLDEVDDLGTFIEFEALVCPERNIAKCHEAIDRLRASFGPALGEAISVSYCDLLLQNVPPAPPPA
jgi:adenylate cyclase, class 2